MLVGVQLVGQRPPRVGVHVDDDGTAVLLDRGIRQRPHGVGVRRVERLKRRRLEIVEIPDALTMRPVGVEHAHASRAHLLGLIVEALDIDDETRQAVYDRTGRNLPRCLAGRNRRRPDDRSDEPVGEVVRQGIKLGVELGVGDNKGRPKALGDHATAMRRVKDDGRMRRGIRHPHVLVEEGGLVRPSLRSHFAGLARSRALHS